VTTASLADLRSCLDEAYASQHSGHGRDETAVFVYQRDIRPLLPWPAAGAVIDLGRGRDEFVRLLQADGLEAEGIDISPEQVSLARSAGVDGVRQGDFRAILVAHPAHCAAITASAAHVKVWQVISARYRIAQAAGTGMLRRHIVTENLTFAAQRHTRPVNTAERDVT